ncbi:CRAL-TRIO domain-containing protein [Cunninghamella echinulata]|nr:CRAL-TRIO domain-containing protein [Cunninghamella echinulata]
MTNQFVLKFKPEETDGVKKLKEDLPNILEEAFSSQEIYTLWGIPLDKESTDERLDVLLVKYLRARELSFDEARKMLIKSLKWRKEFKADDILEESFDEELFGPVGYIHGKDKLGRPVCYNFYGDLDQDKVFADVQRFIRWRIQLMEKCVKLVDFTNVDSMIQVHDYRNASMLGRTTNAKASTKELIQLMQDNYPELLAIKFFVNVPKWGSMIFSLIKPLLPEATVKKFVVCSNNDLLNTLEKSINFDQLPDAYTGNKFKAGSVTAAIKAAQQDKKKAESESLENSTTKST